MKARQARMNKGNKMPICNPLANKTISEINSDLLKREKEFYKHDDAKAHPDKENWEVLEAGMKKIEKSSSRYNLFNVPKTNRAECQRTGHQNCTWCSEYDCCDNQTPRDV